MPADRTRSRASTSDNSTSESVFYVSSASQGVREVAEKVISKRKTWKTLKTRDEAVWPPHIESALIEGLERYRPSTNGDTKLLRRFPKRNRWISEFIFRKTGKQRTAKQVGSRLQQLRDTCQDPHVLQLISRREYTPPLGSSPSVPTGDIAPSGESEVSTPGTTSTSTSQSSTPCLTEITIVIDETKSPSLPGYTVLSIDTSASATSKPNGTDRRITLSTSTLSPSVNPSISIATKPLPSLYSHYSLYRVYEDGNLVHTETTELDVLCSVEPAAGSKNKNKGKSKSKNAPSSRQEPKHDSSPPSSPIFVYATKLIPEYWDHLCSTGDLTRYIIVQEIIRSPPPVPVVKTTPSPLEEYPPSANEPPRTSVVFRMRYGFNYRDTDRNHRVRLHPAVKTVPHIESPESSVPSPVSISSSGSSRSTAGWVDANGNPQHEWMMPADASDFSVVSLSTNEFGSTLDFTFPNHLVGGDGDNTSNLYNPYGNTYPLYPNPYPHEYDYEFAASCPMARSNSSYPQQGQHTEYPSSCSPTSSCPNNSNIKVEINHDQSLASRRVAVEHTHAHLSSSSSHYPPPPPHYHNHHHHHNAHTNTNTNPNSNSTYTLPTERHLDASVKLESDASAHLDHHHTYHHHQPQPQAQVQVQLDSLIIPTADSDPYVVPGNWTWTSTSTPTRTHADTCAQTSQWTGAESHSYSYAHGNENVNGSSSNHTTYLF